MHLPCMLSGTSEKNVFKSFEVNIESFITAVKAAHEVKARLFCPSSIASFGFKENSHRNKVSDLTYQRPETVYGIAKLFIELFGTH
jgi:threonine 3-dehydrogenase